MSKLNIEQRRSRKRRIKNEMIYLDKKVKSLDEEAYEEKKKIFKRMKELEKRWNEL